MGMETRRWVNQSQPQTLVIAVLLLYFNAVLMLLTLLQANGFPTADRLPWLVVLAVVMPLIGGPAAGWGIANERKWGYLLGIAVAATPFVLRLIYLSNPFATSLLSLIFEIALVALLLHPQSREYQRIWFK
jgi:hypothetical protein